MKSFFHMFRRPRPRNLTESAINTRKSSQQGRSRAQSRRSISSQSRRTSVIKPTNTNKLYNTTNDDDKIFSQLFNEIVKIIIDLGKTENQINKINIMLKDEKRKEQINYYTESLNVLNEHLEKGDKILDAKLETIKKHNEYESNKYPNFKQIYISNIENQIPLNTERRKKLMTIIEKLQPKHIKKTLIQLRRNQEEENIKKQKKEKQKTQNKEREELRGIKRQIAFSRGNKHIILNKF